MGAVFKTVCEAARADLGGFDSHTPPPVRAMISWIALNMTPGVGPRLATKLLERFGSPDAVFHARRSELESLRLKGETVESIIRHEFHERAEGELDRVKQLGGDLLILDDCS